MFETEEIEQSNTDESNEASSAPAAVSDESSAEKSAKPTTQEDSLPFHEHPRFKELIEEKNQSRTHSKQLEAQLQQMQQQLQALKQPTHAPEADKRAKMLDRLKTIDPEFAEFVADLAPAKELEELRQWKQQQAAENMRSQAIQSVNQLHSENKVSKEWQDVYNAQLELAAARNPGLKLDDLPALYKQVHENLQGRIEAIKRSERESYLQAKKTDSKVPTSQPKGTSVKAGGKPPEFTGTPEEMRAQLIKRVLSKNKAEQNL